MKHAPGLHPCDRLTAILGMTVLAVAMVLLGSIAVAFYTQLESDRLLQLGATGFFAAVGLSALLFTTRLAGTCWLLTFPSQGQSPRVTHMLILVANSQNPYFFVEVSRINSGVPSGAR